MTEHSVRKGRLPLLVCVGLIAVALVAGCGGGGGVGNGGTGGNSGQGNNPPPPAAPAINYGTGPDGSAVTSFQLSTQTAVSLIPSDTGGQVASWTVTPTLPAGLTFNSSTGAISGAPTSAFAPTNVTVTAQNAGGSSVVTLTLACNSVPLNGGMTSLTLPFNPNTGAAQLAVTNTNVLAEDNIGRQHWVLWNYSTGTILAQGDACPLLTCVNNAGSAPLNVELAGQIAVVPYMAAAGQGAPPYSVPFGFQVLSTSDGSVLATVSPSASVQWWRVATDGSYICGALSQGGNLTAWAPDGSVIATRTGNYSNAIAYCAAGKIQVANGPAGANVIETITVPGGVSTVSPAFAGTFSAWFLDGTAFLSRVGQTVWVYSPAAAQMDMRTLPVQSGDWIGGWGSWFWTAATATTTVSVYKVGASATPATTYSGGLLASQGPTIAVMGTDGSLRVIDLSGSGATPGETDYPSLPLPFTRFDVYAAASATKWVLGSADGVIVDGASISATPRFFGYGELKNIAGSQSRLAVATSIGEVLIYNTSDFSLETTLNYPASQLGISTDGSVLAVREYSGTQVHTVSLPSGTVINTWPYTGGANTPYASDITLSSSGALLGQVLMTNAASPGARQVTSSHGGSILWSDSGSSGPIRLSLDDTLIAAASSDGSTTNVYLNDVLSTAVPGAATGWLLNNDLLVSNAVYNSAGIKQSSPAALPSLSGPIQALSATSIYDGSRNAIYSLATGAATWSTTVQARLPGTVAGHSIAFINMDNQLLTQPY